MKKKITIFLIFVLSMALLGCSVIDENGDMKSLSQGYVIVTDTGSYMFISENGEPISMSDASKDKDLFSDLSTGDQIRIKHGGIMESYPAKTHVYSCKKLNDGDIENINSDTLYSLLMMNHVGRNVFENGEPAIYADENTSMSLQIPEGWSYEINECGDGAYGFGCGISFWPTKYSEGKIYLRYFESGFGVCGTGLEQKETTIAGRKARIGIYDVNETWDFVSFYPKEENIAFIIEDANAWWNEYKEEAIYIMHSMKLVSILGKRRLYGCRVGRNRSEVTRKLY